MGYDPNRECHHFTGRPLARIYYMENMASQDSETVPTILDRTFWWSDHIGVCNYSGLVWKQSHWIVSDGEPQRWHNSFNSFIALGSLMYCCCYVSVCHILSKLSCSRNVKNYSPFFIVWQVKTFHSMAAIQFCYIKSTDKYIHGLSIWHNH